MRKEVPGRLIYSLPDFVGRNRPGSDSYLGQAVLNPSHARGRTAPNGPLSFREKAIMAEFTPIQGRYLAFIHAYTNLHGFPPAESEIAAAIRVSAPSVNQMVKMLEKKGLISRQPGEARTIEILVPVNEIPAWKSPNSTTPRSAARRSVQQETRLPLSTPARLYVLDVYLKGGPIGPKFARKEISRVIEIRGDQTLEHLHDAIFKAYDRWDEHLYEFQFGKRPFDPAGPKYGIPDSSSDENSTKDARTTKLDDLELEQGRVFGYWFDFGDDWFHQIGVQRIDSAIPTVTYPRVVKRVGKSPPQYEEE